MRFLKLIIKIFTHNYCDTCGFTKRDVFISDDLIQCNKCFSKYEGAEQ